MVFQLEQASLVKSAEAAVRSAVAATAATEATAKAIPCACNGVFFLFLQASVVRTDKGLNAVIDAHGNLFFLQDGRAQVSMKCTPVSGDTSPSPHQFVDLTISASALRFSFACPRAPPPRTLSLRVVHPCVFAVARRRLQSNSWPPHWNSPLESCMEEKHGRKVARGMTDDRTQLMEDGSRRR